MSVDRAIEVARKRGVPASDELRLYLVHGALHLCGYDDREPGDRARMRRAESAVLGALGRAKAPRDGTRDRFCTKNGKKIQALRRPRVSRCQRTDFPCKTRAFRAACALSRGIPRTPIAAAALDRRFGIGIHECVGSIAHRSARPARGSEEIVTTAAGRAPKAKKAKRRAPQNGSAGPLVAETRNGADRGEVRKVRTPSNGVRTIRPEPPEAFGPRNGAENGDAVVRRDAIARRDSVDRLWASYRRSPTDASRNRLSRPTGDSCAKSSGASATASEERRRGDRHRRELRPDLRDRGFDPSRGVRFESCELRVRAAPRGFSAPDWLPRPLEPGSSCTSASPRSPFRQSRPADEDVAAEMDMPLEEYRRVFGVGLPGPRLHARRRIRRGCRSGPTSSKTSTATPPGTADRDEILRLVTSASVRNTGSTSSTGGASMREIGRSAPRSRGCARCMRVLRRPALPGPSD